MTNDSSNLELLNYFESGALKMGDSDDDHNDRHSRDKFKRERNDYSFNKRSDWESGNSMNWMGDRYNQARNNSGRDSFGRDQKPNGNYGQRNNRYNDMSPPMKRFRNTRDYDDRMGGGGGNYPSDRPFNRSFGNSYDNSFDNNANRDNDCPTQPIMLTFKQFMNNLDDTTDHIEATTKYNEYKVEFRRKQLTEFFNTHKEEEWFKLKYHPEESIKRKSKLRQYLVSRRECFIDLLREGKIDSNSLDVDKADKITRLLDIAIIKLEGGNEDDIKALDEIPIEEKSKEPELDLFRVDDEFRSNKSQSANSTKNGQLKNDSSLNNSRDNSIKSENSDNVEMDLDKDSEVKKENEEPNELNERPKRKYLHKTSSIFLRSLPANITIEEIEQMFKKYPEFIRIAISEPQIDKKFQRKAWISFERQFDVRDIYLSLNNVKIRDIEIGAIINKDLTRRVRTVNGIASHKNCVLADIRHAAKIIVYLDDQKKIWQKVDEDETEPSILNDQPLKLFGVDSRNPLLRNITEFLIEEASAEEEELLGAELSQIDGGDQTLERNEHSIKVLDRLIYYLRIVHSFDYYNATEYPNEDEMPNRIGLIHVRGLPSLKVQQKDVENYIKTFEQKIAPFIQPNVELSEEELIKLGLRDEEQEIEKFIQENTQEISSDKWLCPLSGKKFKGPDFIRKHLLNKHAERLEEVRQEAKYFNNYVRDVKRMQLPEHPTNRPPVQQSPVNRNNWNQTSNLSSTPDIQPTSAFQMRAQSRLVAQPARLLV